MEYRPSAACSRCTHDHCRLHNFEREMTEMDKLGLIYRNPHTAAENTEKCAESLIKGELRPAGRLRARRDGHHLRGQHIPDNSVA